MTLETDLSRSPYFDDFEANSNFYQVLYRPAVAVQARELNQMQSILQDQINKFGSHVFKDGSVVEGCSFTFDNNYRYVKIEDNYANNFAIGAIEDFKDRLVRNTNGLEAVVINTAGGFESQDPDLNTLYIKYLNAATFPNGSIQSTFANGEILQISTTANVAVGNVVVATVANSTGRGYAFTTSEGVIFKKGYFIRVEPQTLIVSKYSNQPNNVSVGFDAIEDIVTPEVDTSLLDNAAGSPNFEAPGAHRLRLNSRLVSRVTSASNTESFFSLCDFQNGLPITIKTDPQYAALGLEQARRTFETNGDYVVNPFLLRTGRRISNTTHLNLISSPGIGYVKGTRVELINESTVPLRKGLDFETVANQTVTANFGYYFRVNEFCGDFNNDQVAQIELHSVAKTAITNRQFLGVSYSTSTKIGTAYVRGVALESGTAGVDAVYDLYVFNIRMDPGFSINDARSLIYYSSSVRAVADIVLTYDAATASNTARIQEATGEVMVYPFGQKALKADGFSNQEFVYRNKGTANFGTSGNASITISTTVPGGTESITPTGTYSASSKRGLVVVPTANGFSANLNGGVTAYSTNTLISGNATATFASDYAVGDYIYANNETRRIASIVNNTVMFADAAFTTNTSAGIVHQKAYPAGVPINLDLTTRIVTANTSTLVVSLGQSVNAAFGASFYFDVNRESNVPILKGVVKNALVKIDLANNAAGTTGPWCLGLPDVLKINHVYVGASGSYSNANPDLLSSFTLDNGQRDAYYDLAYISTNRLFTSNTSLLVDLDHFTTDTSQGVGFFTVKSYPIDDANTANTTAIQTIQIPTYTTKSTKEYIDLRDAVDFRPFAVNTAVSTTTAASATINPANTLTLFSYGGSGSYLPSPDTAYESTIQYYLPRKDRVSLATSGRLVITEGISSVLPILPAEPSGTMTLGTIDVPPYPSLDTSSARVNSRYDYAVQVNSQQTKRYTMAQIGTLAQRIDNLEYYTSLSLLEQAASSLLVRSGVTGENRFKNGILVDPFRDHTIGNTLDPQYKIAVDSNRNELRPAASVTKMPVVFDRNNSNNVTRVGDLILLSYSNTVTQVQRFASTTVDPVVGNFYGYRGTMTLSPPGDLDPDYSSRPEVLSNIDLNANWVNLSRPWDTQWGAWTAADLARGPERLTVQSLNSQATTSIPQQTQVINSQLSTAPTTSTVSAGAFVSNVSLLPFLRPRFVFFTARGLKPFARLYPYFANARVSEICMPVRLYTGSVVVVNGVVRSTPNDLPVATDTYGNTYEFNYDGTDYGSPLFADAEGTVYGVMRIPPRTFRSGEIEFKLQDTSSLTITGVTTQASAIFYGTVLSVIRDNINIDIRPPVPQRPPVSSNPLNPVNPPAPTPTPSPAIQPTTPPPPPVYDYVYISDGGGGGDPSSSPQSCNPSSTNSCAPAADAPGAPSGDPGPGDE